MMVLKGFIYEVPDKTLQGYKTFSSKCNHCPCCFYFFADLKFINETHLDKQFWRF